MVIAALVGWSHGRAEVENRADFLRAIGYTVASACAWGGIFLFAFLGVFSISAGSVFSVIGFVQFFAMSALFFIPVAIITFIWRNIRSRSE